MFKNVIAWLSLILNKKVCSASQLSRACKYVQEYCSKDEDGNISVKEVVFMLIDYIKMIKYLGDKDA